MRTWLGDLLWILPFWALAVSATFLGDVGMGEHESALGALRHGLSLVRLTFSDFSWHLRIDGRGLLIAWAVGFLLVEIQGLGILGRILRTAPPGARRSYAALVLAHAAWITWLVGCFWSIGILTLTFRVWCHFGAPHEPLSINYYLADSCFYLAATLVLSGGLSLLTLWLNRTRG